MEKKTVKLWDVVYVILYNNHYPDVDTVAVIKELQDTDNFILTDEQHDLLYDLIDDLYESFNMDIPTYGTENGEEDTDYIINEYNLNGDLPVITYDPITGQSVLNTDMNTYELK